jgi:hypothetical protein
MDSGGSGSGDGSDGGSKGGGGGILATLLVLLAVGALIWGVMKVIHWTGGGGNPSNPPVPPPPIDSSCHGGQLIGANKDKDKAWTGLVATATREGTSVAKLCRNGAVLSVDDLVKGDAGDWGCCSCLRTFPYQGHTAERFVGTGPSCSQKLTDADCGSYYNTQSLGRVHRYTKIFAPRATGTPATTGSPPWSRLDPTEFCGCAETWGGSDCATRCYSCDNGSGIEAPSSTDNDHLPINFDSTPPGYVKCGCVSSGAEWLPAPGEPGGHCWCQSCFKDTKAAPLSTEGKASAPQGWRNEAVISAVNVNADEGNNACEGCIDLTLGNNVATDMVPDSSSGAMVQVAYCVPGVLQKSEDQCIQGVGVNTVNGDVECKCQDCEPQAKCPTDGFCDGGDPGQTLCCNTKADDQSNCKAAKGPTCGTMPVGKEENYCKTHTVGGATPPMAYQCCPGCGWYDNREEVCCYTPQQSRGVGWCTKHTIPPPAHAYV